MPEPRPRIGVEHRATGHWGRCVICGQRKRLRASWLRCDDCLDRALAEERAKAAAS